MPDVEILYDLGKPMGMKVTGLRAGDIVHAAGKMYIFTTDSSFMSFDNGEAAQTPAEEFSAAVKARIAERLNVKA